MKGLITSAFILCTMAVFGQTEVQQSINKGDISLIQGTQRCFVAKPAVNNPTLLSIKKGDVTKQEPLTNNAPKGVIVEQKPIEGEPKN